MLSATRMLFFIGSITLVAACSGDSNASFANAGGNAGTTQAGGAQPGAGAAGVGGMTSAAGGNGNSGGAGVGGDATGGASAGGNATGGASAGGNNGSGGNGSGGNGTGGNGTGGNGSGGNGTGGNGSGGNGTGGNGSGGNGSGGNGSGGNGSGGNAGNCFSCNSFITSCYQNATCPNESELCPAAVPSYTPLKACFCNTCSASCDQTCNGVGMDSNGCSACIQSTAASCQNELTVCSMN